MRRPTADDVLGKVYEMDVWLSVTNRTPARFTVTEVDGASLTAWSHRERRPEPMDFNAFCEGLREGLIWEVAVSPYSSMLVRPIV